ncbi:MAG: hypothetical protein LBL92_02810 [Propionibacteriaceae bacterium]|jgi:hypothetical protein|nr:hypothetical protein [Propionibacteriaceae bacterium]
MPRRKRQTLGDGQPSPSVVSADDPEIELDDPDAEVDDDIISRRRSRTATDQDLIDNTTAEPTPAALADEAAGATNLAVTTEPTQEPPAGRPSFTAPADTFPATVAPSPDDPDAEVNDDIVTRRKAARTDAAAAKKPSAMTTTPVNALLLLLALVVGIILGVWITGRLQDSGDDTTSTGEMTAMPTAAASSDLTEEEMAAQIAELETQLASNPDDTSILLDLGVLRFNSGNLSGAAESWQRVLDLEPDNEYAWYFMAYYYRALPDDAGLEQAIAAFTKVIEVAPGSELATSAQTHLDAWTASTTEPAATAPTASEPS